MAVYNMKGYSDNNSKTFGNLWQYYRDEPILDSNCLDFQLKIQTKKTKQNKQFWPKKILKIGFLKRFRKYFLVPLKYY